MLFLPVRTSQKRVAMNGHEAYNEAVKILNRLFPEMNKWYTEPSDYLLKIKLLGFETWQEFTENYYKNN